MAANLGPETVVKLESHMWAGKISPFFRRPLHSSIVRNILPLLSACGTLASSGTSAGRSSTIVWPSAAAIFATISVIEDRHQGFLQMVPCGPGSRGALVAGKSLGSASVALSQAALFLLLSPLAGFAPGAVDWPLLAAALFLSALGLAAVGFAVAWVVDNVQGYHAIQMTLLVPLWVISGAMFPMSADHPGFAAAIGPMAASRS